MYEKIVKESKVLSNNKYSKIFDLATGQGRFLQMLTDNVQYDVAFGCDISKDKLRIAREKLKDKKSILFLVDGTQLPFLDSEFDLVSISNSLHHFEDVDKVIIEASRILKKEGILLINEIISDDLTEAQEVDMKLSHLFVSIDKILGYIHNYSYSSYEVKNIRSLNSDIYELIEERIYADDNYNINVMEKKKIEYMFNVIDKKLEKIIDKPEYKRLLEEGEFIKSKIMECGLSMQKQISLLYKKR